VPTLKRGHDALVLTHCLLVVVGTVPGKIPSVRFAERRRSNWNAGYPLWLEVFFTFKRELGAGAMEFMR